MSLTDENLDILVNQMLKLQEENKEKELTLEELKEIALTVGVKEFEWTEMMENAEKNAVSAKKHLDFKNYQDAYETALKTISINPYHTQALIIAADSALKIYETEDKDEYLEKSEVYARKVLKISPEELRAFKILAIIENHEKKEESHKKKIILLIVAVTIGLGVLVGLFFAIKSIPKKENTKVKFELIEAQENANAAWAQVENVINRRDQIIPELLVAVENENIEYSTTLQELEKLQEDLKTVSDDEKIDIQVQIQAKTKELTGIIAQNSNSEQVELLMVQIEGAYNRISVETRRYNDEVKEYNVLVKKYSDEFPDFKQMQYYNQQ